MLEKACLFFSLFLPILPPPLNFDLVLAIAAKSPYLFVETGFSKCSFKSFSSQENFCDPLLELVLQDL